MKLPLACAAIAALLIAVPRITPASARDLQPWITAAIGQDVYNLRNMRVGRLERYIDVRGTPGVIIANDAPGGRTIIVQAENLTKRDGGGLLLMLSDTAVVRAETYRPGRLPFW